MITPSFGKLRNFLQVVWVGMMAAMVVLSIGVFMLMERETQGEQPPSTILIAGGAVLSVCVIGIAAALPVLARTRFQQATIAQKLQGVVFSRVVLGGALEGAGLYWAVVALLLKNPVLLAGPFACLVIMAVLFPTQGRLEVTLEMSEEQIDRELGRLGA